VKVLWTDEALRDLREIHSYIVRDSEAAANKVTSEIGRRSAELHRFPRLGRIVPEDPLAQARELIVSSYRVIYDVIEDGALILAVVHGKRQLSDFFARRERQ